MYKISADPLYFLKLDTRRLWGNHSRFLMQNILCSILHTTRSYLLTEGFNEDNNCSKSSFFFAVSSLMALEDFLILSCLCYSSCRRVLLDFTTMTSCATAGLHSFLGFATFLRTDEFQFKLFLGQTVYRNQFWRTFKFYIQVTLVIWHFLSPR